MIEVRDGVWLGLVTRLIVVERFDVLLRQRALLEHADASLSSETVLMQSSCGDDCVDWQMTCREA